MSVLLPLFFPLKGRVIESGDDRQQAGHYSQGDCGSVNPNPQPLGLSKPERTP